MCPFANGRYTLLVVDDDPGVLGCTRRCLERAGYEVRTESDPQRVSDDPAGLADVDLILLDYRMPGMTGLALLERLRRNGVRARCILVSAYVNEDVRTQARALGVDRVLDKPVDVELLRAALSEVLGSAGTGRRAGSSASLN